MENKIKLGSNSKICIKWSVPPIYRTDEIEENIKAKFVQKYGIKKENITIEPIYISSKNSYDISSLNDASQNIQDPLFQQNLFKQFLNEKEITDYDFDKIIEIDNVINNNIDYEIYDKHKKYSFKWIKWSNFMSYGKDNYFDFTNLKGLTLLSSEPSNQGGKTTFCLDLFRFLLFGKVTSRESDWTLSKVFNNYLPEITEVNVEGCITIDDVDYVIKRTVTRPSLEKRTDKSKVTNKVKYYKLIDNEYVELNDEDGENLEGSTITETNKNIKEAIGNERDFDLMICVNSDNLKGLISLKDAERGRLLSRWIGLLPIEEKDKIARETFNKTIMPSLLLNKYNKTELESEIKEMEELIKEDKKSVKEYENKKDNSDKNLVKYREERDILLQSKRNVDENLTKTDVETIKNQNKNLTEQGINKKLEKEKNEKRLQELSSIEFDENDYKSKIKEDKQISLDLNDIKHDCIQIKNEVEALKKGEFCPTCGAKLKDVDNTQKISEKQSEYNVLIEKGKEKKKKLDKLDQEIFELEETRTLFQEKGKLEITVQKNEVDLENLRSKLRENNRLIKDIQDNEETIIKNNEIDIKINIVNTNIKTEERINSDTVNKINSFNEAIRAKTKIIDENNKKIGTITKEEELVKNWKIYLEMVGKNGISKMVLRNALPLINGELRRLLSDVCDFNIEVAIDDHNDVAFYKIHDGVKANLSSGSGFEQTVASLALRSVLSEISTFSKPSFVIFDEVLGGVADENYDQVKKLIDRIIANYSFIFFITHVQRPKEWADRFVVVKKENNISKIYQY